MAQLYSNENFPFPVVVELRRLGHDVLTVLEAGQAERIDAALREHSNTSGELIRVNRPPQ